jgi:hypothetical protein
MEYERALYRVYERSLDSQRRDQPCCFNSPLTQPSKLCNALIRGSVLAAAVMFVCVMWLHCSFVGRPGCLLDHLRPLVTTNSSGSRLIDEDSLLSIAIGRTDDPPVDFGQNATFDADYEFSINPLIVQLSQDFRGKHAVVTYNVTLPPQCFGSGAQLWLVENIVGYDAIIINQLMYSFKSSGQIHNFDTREDWVWTEAQLEEPDGFIAAIVAKIEIVVYSLFSFFFTSTVTAFVVRILISSGVAIMFPFVFCLRALGMQNLSLRILTDSYPWLGHPVEHLQAVNRSTRSLIFSHLAKAMVFYMMYQACQLAWAAWLYNKSVPNGLLMWIYSLMMLWEYFAMIFIRSRLAINFFPRITLLLFLFFHFYFHSFAYGYFFGVLGIVAILMFANMLYCVHKLEVPALTRGSVSFEHPRELFVELGWPTWSAALPPSFTLFHPLNGEWRGVFQEDDADIPPPSGHAVQPLHAGAGSLSASDLDLELNAPEATSIRPRRTAVRYDSDGSNNDESEGKEDDDDDDDEEEEELARSV